MKYSRKGHKDRNRHKNRIKKKEWASSVGSCHRTGTATSPLREGEPAGTLLEVNTGKPDYDYSTGEGGKV